MSARAAPDKYGNPWQYHSQSDHHSKVACWSILLDLLRECPLFRNHVDRGCVGFGINHPLMDFENNRPKRLDLVICTPGTPLERPTDLQRLTFRQLVNHYGVVLSPSEEEELAGLPDILPVPVGGVLVALEAKACMTEHIKAIPRLYDELNSSIRAIHGSSNNAVAAGLAMVNASTRFVSPGRNKVNMSETAAAITRHKQPDCSLRVMEDAVLKIPRRSTPTGFGYDALGMIVVDAANDGSPIELVSGGPIAAELLDYGFTIRKICTEYRSRHSAIC